MMCFSQQGIICWFFAPVSLKMLPHNSNDSCILPIILYRLNYTSRWWLLFAIRSVSWTEYEHFPESSQLIWFRGVGLLLITPCVHVCVCYCSSSQFIWLSFIFPHITQCHFIITPYNTHKPLRSIAFGLLLISMISSSSSSSPSTSSNRDRI